MGFFKRVLGKKAIESNINDIIMQIEQKESEEVVEENLGLKDFDNEMYQELERMKLKVSKLETYMPEKSEELRVLVDDLESNFQNIEVLRAEIKIREEEKRQEALLRSIRGETTINPLELPQENIIKKEVELELYFQSKLTVFNTKYNMINQEYLMKCAENLSKRINKVIYVEDLEKYQEYGEEQLIADLKQYYEQLVSQIDEFKGIQKNVYISKLKEASYKLKILDTVQLEQYDYNSKVKKWFSSRSKADRIVENRLILSEVARLKNEYTELRKLFQEEKVDLEDECIAKLENIQEKINIETIEELEDISEETATEIIEIIRNVRDYRMNLEERIEEKQEEKEEGPERIKRKEQKMRKKLKEIDDKEFDVEESYKKIWEYERRKLEEENLLDDKSLVKNENVDITVLRKRNVVNVIKKAEELGISNYSICIDNDNVYLIKSKNDAIDISLPKIEKMDTNNTRDLSNAIITEEVASIFKEDENGYYIFSVNGENRISTRAEQRLKYVIKNVANTFTTIDNIKFHIELPYTRPILSVLTQLKEKGIDYYILPLEELEAKIKDSTIKIYMDRKDLDKYKAVVHREISNPQDGIVKIYEENIDIADLLLEGCENIEFLREDEKERE